jgi:hypothetical protein
MFAFLLVTKKTTYEKNCFDHCRNHCRASGIALVFARSGPCPHQTHPVLRELRTRYRGFSIVGGCRPGYSYYWNRSHLLKLKARQKRIKLFRIIMKDKKVDEYIDKQKSPQKEICNKLREIILKMFPDIKEKMKWGVPSYTDGKYYFVALKTHVNLSFSIKGLTEEDIALFDGGGKTTKHYENRFKTINKLYNGG